MGTSERYSNERIQEIYSRYIDMVYRVCFSYLKNSSDTEDAVQTTFLKLIDKSAEFKSQEHEKAWLIVTASNQCKDMLKSKSYGHDDIADYEYKLETPPFEVDDTLNAVLDLPEKYKTIVYMYYYEGYKTKEIGHMLKIPHSTVRNHLQKARELLRERLGGGIDG